MALSSFAKKGTLLIFVTLLVFIFSFSFSSKSFAADPSVPSAPTNITLTPGDTIVRLDFTQPSDVGSPITNYEYSINNGSSWTALSPASVVSPIIISGLTNNVSVPITLRAVNINGFSAASASQNNIVTPLATPPTPQNVIVDNSTITWRPPFWASTISTYFVVYKNWADRNNPNIHWGVYAARTNDFPASWPGGISRSVSFTATPNNCGTVNTGNGWGFCPLPYGTMTNTVDGYAVRVFAESAGTHTYGVLSPIQQYIPPVPTQFEIQKNCLTSGNKIPKAVVCFKARKLPDGRKVYDWTTPARIYTTPGYTRSLVQVKRNKGKFVSVSYKLTKKVGNRIYSVIVVANKPVVG